MWTTEPDTRTETINDEDARVLLQEQMRRRIEAIQDRERESREREQMAHWQETERELRDRMLRGEWPDPPRDRRETEVERRRETIGFLKDFIDGKEPKKKED